MKILVDTSIWIDFFKIKEPISSTVSNLVNSQKIVIANLVEAELLQGARNDTEISDIQEVMFVLPRINDLNYIRDAALLSGKMKWANKGLSLIDSTLVYMAWNFDYKIWTLDKNLAKAAGENFLYKH